MNEKDKKSLAIISGVFIFALVFMVFFTFYRKDALLSNRTVPKINTDLNGIEPEIDPPNFGDTLCSNCYTICGGVTSCIASCQATCVNSTPTPKPSTPTPKPSTPKPSTPKPSTPTPKPARPSSCLTADECQMDANDCMYGSNGGCHVSGTSNGYTCYSQTCNSAPSSTSTPKPSTPTPASFNCSGIGDSGSCNSGQAASYCTWCVAEGKCKAKGSSCGSSSTPTPTPTSFNCSGISDSGSCNSGQAASYCTWCVAEGKCKSKGSSCGSSSTPTPTPVGYSPMCSNPCCINGVTINNASACTTVMPAGARQCGACASSASTPTPTPSGTTSTRTCYHFENNKCSAVSSSSTTCNTSNNDYPTWYDCRNNISCSSNQYKYGDNCISCSAGKTLTYSGCQGNSTMCCVDENSQTKKCYRLLNGVCSEVTIGGNTCGSAGNYYDTEADCKNRATSTGSSTPSTGSKCCCNLATGHCALATTCTGSLPTEQSQITSAASCNALDAGNGSACYKSPTGSYVWGFYGNDISYTYTVALDKEACENKNSSTSSSSGVNCTLRCPVSVIKPGEHIMCTFESSDGSRLNGSSGGTVSGNYVDVSADANGNLSVSGSSSTCTSNTVAITVLSSDTSANGCTITSVSTGSVKTSNDGDGYSSNSYYIVFVNVEGLGCNKNTLSLSATNASSISPSSVSITTSARTAQYAFHVYPNSGCNSKSTPTARLSNGSSKTGPTVTLTTDWSKQENVCESNPTYTSFLQADMAGADEYYSAWDSSQQCYTIKWTRGGCGSSSSSSSSSTPTPKPSTTYACYANAKELINATATTWATNGSTAYPYLISGVSQADCKAYACFVNSDGTDYKWANTTPSGYTKVPDILAKSECKSEEPACYIDSSGNYDWGKHKNDPKYTYVASITEESKCKKTPGAACYSNGDDYVWDTTPPAADYEKVPDLGTPEVCKPDVVACFLHDNRYVWGDYANKPGYIYVGGIEEEEYCANIGCFTNKDGEYVWGDYSDNTDYTLVPDITDRYKCGYTPDVPKTAMNVQTIVYLAVALMSVAGVYLVVRYNNKSKNVQ